MKTAAGSRFWPTCWNWAAGQPTCTKGLAACLDPDKINVLYLYGPEMNHLYQALLDKYGQQNLHYYPEDEMSHLIDDLKSDIHSQDIVLLKGSHGMHLETSPRQTEIGEQLKFTELG